MEQSRFGQEQTLRDLPLPVWQLGMMAAVVLVILAAGLRWEPPVLAADAADSWAARGRAAGVIADARPGLVSFAVLDASGAVVASHNADNKVSAASTIKAMILVGYLRQPDVALRELGQSETAAMTRMVTASSNTDATTMLGDIGWDSMQELADEAGMGDGFVPDTRRWGLTDITAASMATFFYRIPDLVPQRHRQFALNLFSQIIPGQRWGMPQVTPTGWSWHIKGGWISRVVNQIGSFTRGTEEFTVAITVEGEPGTGSGVSAGPESVPAVRTLQLVALALFGDGTIPGSAGSGVPPCLGQVAEGNTEEAARWGSLRPCPPVSAEV